MQARWVSAVIVPLAVLAACGGGDDASTATEVPVTEVPAVSGPATKPTTPATEPAPTEPTTTPTEPSTTAAPATAPPTAPSTEPVDTEPPVPDTEPEAAAWALLRLDDFADGWSAEPYDPADDAGDAETSAQIALCAGVDADLISATVLGDTRAVSDTFIDPSGTFSVEDRVGFAADEATALDAMAAIGDEAIPDCYALAIEANIEAARTSTDPAETLPPGLTFGTPIVERVQLDDVAGDEIVMYAVELPLESGGATTSSFSYLLFARAGRVLTQLKLDGNGEPFPNDLIADVAEIASLRAHTINEI